MRLRIELERGFGRRARHQRGVRRGHRGKEHRLERCTRRVGVHRRLSAAPRIAGCTERGKHAGGKGLAGRRRRKLLDPRSQRTKVPGGSHQRAAAIAERIRMLAHHGKRGGRRSGLAHLHERRGQGRRIDGAVGDGSFQLRASRCTIARGDEESSNACAHGRSRRRCPAGHRHGGHRFDGERLARLPVAAECTQEPLRQHGALHLAPRRIVHQDRERHACARHIAANQLRIGRERHGAGVGHQRDAAREHDEGHVGARTAERCFPRLQGQLRLRARCGIDATAGRRRCIATERAHRHLDAGFVEAQPEEAAGECTADRGSPGIGDGGESVDGQVRPCPSEECRRALRLARLERVDPQGDERLHVVRVERQHRLPVSTRPGSITGGAGDLGPCGAQLDRPRIKPQRSVDVVHGPVELAVEQALLAAHVPAQRFGFGGAAGKRRGHRWRSDPRRLAHLTHCGGERNGRTTQRRNTRSGDAGGRKRCRGRRSSRCRCRCRRGSRG